MDRAWRIMGRVMLWGVGALVIFLLAGNLTIMSIALYARHHIGVPAAAVDIDRPAGVNHFRAVTERLWRGSAPDEAAYNALAGAGVKTIVDLRTDGAATPETLARLGMNVVHIPIRDGQVPSAADVTRFTEVVDGAPGPVFVHCNAGVGRTGAMVAAYLVSTGRAGPKEALRNNLAVGPPSLEQIAYVAELDGGVGKPGFFLTAVSRMLDGPRRIWARVF